MKTKDNKPVSGTGEWAAHVQNIQNGCEHDCKYCYAKTQAIRFGKNTSEGWKTPVENPGVLDKVYGKKNGTIMFPTTHDITPLNIVRCGNILIKMLEAGNKVLIVSKPHFDCIADLCDMLEDYREQILFRFTIGSADDAVLKFWEPNAPSFADRLDCLKYAFKAAYYTSVSCEPMLDASVDKVVDKVRAYVTDSIWIGKPNKLMLRTQMNGASADTMEAAEKWMAIYTDEFIQNLYDKYKSDPLVKWKDSIKQVVGLERPMVKGLDK